MPKSQAKPSSKPVEDLPDLTPQQFAFVQGLLAGKSASDAYRAAYDCSSMAPESVWSLASRLRANVKVASWLTAARVALMGKGTVTLEDHCLELARLRELAVAEGKVNGAVAAEIARGRASGLYVEQYRDLTGQDDPVTLLNRLAEISPEFASIVAQKHGIDWRAPSTEATKH